MRGFHLEQVHLRPAQEGSGPMIDGMDRPLLTARMELLFPHSCISTSFEFVAINERTASEAGIYWSKGLAAPYHGVALSTADDFNSFRFHTTLADILSCCTLRTEKNRISRATLEVLLTELYRV